MLASLLRHLTPGDRAMMLPQLDALKDKRLMLLDQDAVFRWQGI